MDVPRLPFWPEVKGWGDGMLTSARKKKKSSDRVAGTLDARARSNVFESDVGDDSMKDIIRKKLTYLVGVEELSSAHQGVHDHIVFSIGDVLVEVEARLEVDGFGLGDGRRAHFEEVVVVVVVLVVVEVTT